MNAAGRTGELSARIYRDDDEQAVVALLTTAFAGWPVEPSLASVAHEFLRWKHLRAPWGRSLLIVVENERGLVGARGYMPWRLRAGGRAITAYRAVDSATHPSVQGRGAAQAISACFIKLTARGRDPMGRGAADLLFATPNDLALDSALRARGDAAPRQPHVIGSLGLSVRITPAGEGGRRAGARSPQLHIAADSAADVLADDALVAPLLEEVQAAEPRISTARTVEYLRWRYADLIPYCAVTLECEGRLVGLAILRAKEDEWGFVEARITEFLVESGNRAAADRLLEKVLRAAQADWAVACIPPKSAGAAALRAARFGVEPEGWPLLVYEWREPIEPDPTALASWALAFGDFEGEII